MMIHKFELIHKKLNNAIEFYYTGKPASAYKELKELLIQSKYGKYLSESYKGNFNIKDYRSNNELHWFRLRELSEKERKDPKASSLFHPPFEKRGNVGNYRFSIFGFPCLYLGDSINTSWEEINKEKDYVFASRLTLTGNQSFLSPLNITIPEPFPETIYDNIEPIKKEVFNFLITFPVIQLCLFKVKDTNTKDSFKPEYIIPQLLLQFVIDKDEKCEGGFYNSIVYTSTKKTNNKPNHNLVIPVRKVLNCGFCPELQKAIKVTEPLPVSTFNQADFEKIECELLEMKADLLSTK